MKKAIIISIVFAFLLALCSCGENVDEPLAYVPQDIHVETLEDGATAFTVIYKCSTKTTDWTGYPESARELNTAVYGIKKCMAHEEWNDHAIVYGYSREARPKNMLYSYGEHGRDQIDFYQGGAFNVSYTLSGELERGKLP